MVDRADILYRASHGWPYRGVPYSQSSTWSDGYRQDCSGFVSMCLGIARPGDSTVSLVTNGHVTRIDGGGLAGGDVVGLLGPGTGGNGGHVLLFEAWTGPVGGNYWGWEQSGDGPGPIRRIIGYPYDGMSGYAAYRYVGATGNIGSPVDLDHISGLEQWRAAEAEYLRRKAESDVEGFVRVDPSPEFDDVHVRLRGSLAHRTLLTRFYRKF